MTRPLRSTSITPASSLQRNRLSAAARFRRRGNDLRAFHSLWVGKAGGELLRSSPPLAGASVLSASRFEPLAGCPGRREFRGGALPENELRKSCTRFRDRGDAPVRIPAVFTCAP